MELFRFSSLYAPFFHKKRGYENYRNPLILLVAGTTRLELATSGVTGRRSNQAELRPRGRRNRI
ncbi:hypothetical protein TRIP_B350170 [uncultured Desulfatiglans sp.]|uniref:Uncharacterized protein n=1 Tax=Uncultured Desulfatiglans sp. TaxID=1748965 RepID=A0A653AAE0_UNCDX|nr:hypothetical protein TRIP_B350170 [uncultured Desulfatiglans sp.]